MYCENLNISMRFFNKEAVLKVLQYINNELGEKQRSISEKTGIPIPTINNIRTGRSAKKEYFDKLIEAYPEALAALEHDPPTPDAERKVLFQELGETASKLAEIKMMNRLRALVPRLEASENMTEEELEALLLAYEVLGIKAPPRFIKK